MTRISNIVLALPILFSVAACVETRDPNPVSTQKNIDQSLSCSDMGTEYASNTEIAANKIKKNESDDTQDILLGALIWPGLADFKNADGIEGNALLDRNIHLRQIAIGKGCDITTWPEQPKRYR